MGSVNRPVFAAISELFKAALWTEGVQHGFGIKHVPSQVDGFDLKS